MYFQAGCYGQSLTSSFSSSSSSSSSAAAAAAAVNNIYYTIRLPQNSLSKKKIFFFFFKGAGSCGGREGRRFNRSSLLLSLREKLTFYVRMTPALNKIVWQNLFRHRPR